jgi:hypothetical protein
MVGIGEDVNVGIGVKVGTMGVWYARLQLRTIQPRARNRSLREVNLSIDMIVAGQEKDSYNGEDHHQTCAPQRPG